MGMSLNFYFRKNLFLFAIIALTPHISEAGPDCSAPDITESKGPFSFCRKESGSVQKCFRDGRETQLWRCSSVVNRAAANRYCAEAGGIIALGNGKYVCRADRTKCVQYPTRGGAAMGSPTANHCRRWYAEWQEGRRGVTASASTEADEDGVAPVEAATSPPTTSVESAVPGGTGQTQTCGTRASASGRCLAQARQWQNGGTFYDSLMAFIAYLDKQKRDVLAQGGSDPRPQGFAAASMSDLQASLEFAQEDPVRQRILRQLQEARNSTGSDREARINALSDLMVLTPPQTSDPLAVACVQPRSVEVAAGNPAFVGSGNTISDRYLRANLVEISSSLDRCVSQLSDRITCLCIQAIGQFRAVGSGPGFERQRRQITRSLTEGPGDDRRALRQLLREEADVPIRNYVAAQAVQEIARREVTAYRLEYLAANVRNMLPQLGSGSAGVDPRTELFPHLLGACRARPEIATVCESEAFNDLKNSVLMYCGLTNPTVPTDLLAAPTTPGFDGAATLCSSDANHPAPAAATHENSHAASRAGASRAERAE